MSSPEKRPSRTGADAGLGALARLVNANPFLPERTECEREVLGEGYAPATPVWTARAGAEVVNPNVAGIARRAESAVAAARRRIAAGAADEIDRRHYEEVALYVLYARFEDRFWELIVLPPTANARARVTFYRDFARDTADLFHVPGLATLREPGTTEHLFACFFQLRRAFHFIHWNILGRSLPAARLRALTWQSIFTHDLRRYRRSLYARMHDATTLITGPSGTGKELVARAIALSRYIAFDARPEVFTDDFRRSFWALNLSALSPTLVESELFGHRRGSFTGAVQDRAGWLELCPPFGTIFLDEIGELDAALQVKLLRVLQTRTFQRIGESEDREFRGKIVAATNRDLAADMASGRFRPDFYYRLCSDVVRTPSLRERLDDDPDELHDLLAFIAGRAVSPEDAGELAAETAAWITSELGRDYPWPGNVRELEQCLRNVLTRGEYRPPQLSAADRATELARSIEAGSITADELVTRYCAEVYRRTRSYQETARRLGLDRRTVKSRVHRPAVKGD